MSILAGKTVFLACTNEFFDLATHLTEKLRSNGVKPIWFHDVINITVANDAMTACLKNAASSDYLVWLIGRRFGLPHSSGISISEAEFWAARRNGKPTLILVRDAVKAEAKRYHDDWKHLSSEDRQKKAAEAKLKTEARQLEMIERLMHTKNAGESAVPWMETFHDVWDAFQQVFQKWADWQVQQVESRPPSDARQEPLLFPISLEPPQHAPLQNNSVITDLQSWLEYVYRDRKLERPLPLSRFGAALAAAGGEFMSRKRRTIGEFPTALARYVEMLLRACNAAGINAEREAFNKFPHCCAYCQLETCKMATSRPGTQHGEFDQVAMLDIAEQRRPQHGPFTLDTWAEEICAIYPMNWSLSLPQLIERLNEEQGEFVEALQKLERARKREEALLVLAEETADVLSWTVVFAQAVRRGITEAAGNEDIMNVINQMVVDKYKVGCPRCKKFRCVRRDQCAL